MIKLIINFLIVVVIILLFSSTAHALRCGNEIINEGSSEREVRQNCQIDDEYTVNNQNADIKKIYNEQNGMTNEIIIVDGKVQSIDSERQ